MAMGPVGSQLDDAKVAYELAIRGINARQLAAKAGLNEITLARARRGQRVRPDTLIKVAIALKHFPVRPELVAILPDPPGNGNGHPSADLHDVKANVPETKTTSATQAAGRRGGHGDGSTTTRRRKA